MVQLLNRLERAAVWLEGPQMRLEGMLSQWDQTGVVMRLPDLPGAETMLQPGMEVMLTLYFRQGTQQARAEVTSFQGDECAFRFLDEKSTPLGKRRRARYPCQISTRFRELGAEGNEWCHGKAVDIGLGGMKIVSAENITLPGKLEVVFQPAGYDVDVNAIGHVTHCRLEPGGLLAFGVAFDELPRLDQVWLERLFS